MSKKYEYEESFIFDGKRYRIRASSERKLHEKVALKKKELQEGKVIISGSMTVRQWTETCMEAYKGNVSDDYLHQMKWRIEKHILSEIGFCPVRSIKPLQLQVILNKQKGCSKSHITKVKNELFFIFDKARDNHLILENPASNLVKPEGYSNKRRSLTASERKHFESIMETDPRFRLFQLMLYCGCRSSEAGAVLRTDFTLSAGYPQLHIRGTKTVNSDRYVPVPLDFYNRIKDLHGLIAPNNAGKQMDDSSYKRLVSTLKREMNISMGCRVYRNQLVPPYPLASDFVPYMFRHTYCTDLQKAGVDIRTAQILMGHADISTTANIYTHQDHETLAKAARLLGAM